MNVYHRTTDASAILTEGFHDTTHVDVAGDQGTGVRVSIDPSDRDESTKKEGLLTLQIAGDVFRAFEWFEDRIACRESVVPAAILNRYGPPALVTDEDSFSPRYEGRLVIPEPGGSRRCGTRSGSLDRPGWIGADDTGPAEPVIAIAHVPFTIPAGPGAPRARERPRRPDPRPPHGSAS